MTRAGSNASRRHRVNGFVRVSIAITIVLTAVTGALELRRLVKMSRA